MKMSERKEVVDVERFASQNGSPMSCYLLVLYLRDIDLQCGKTISDRIYIFSLYTRILDYLAAWAMEERDRSRIRQPVSGMPFVALIKVEMVEELHDKFQGASLTQQVFFPSTQ